MVRELSQAPVCFLFDCCVFIARFASLSCYSSAKTRIRPVKSYHLCTICVEIYTKGPPSSCRNMYLWYVLILLHLSMKEIFHFKWRLIDDVVGFFISPAAGCGNLTHLLCVSLVSLIKQTVSKMSL